MQGIVNPNTVQRNAYHAPAAGFQAQVTISGVADECHVIDAIYYGYDVAPAAAKLLDIAFGTIPTGTVKWGTDIPADVTAIGPHQKTFPKGLSTGIKGEDVLITLPAGGAGRIAKLNVTYR